MKPLAGRRVVITRPQGQAEELARRVRAAGGEPLCIPAIEIRPLPDLAAFHEAADRLETFDLAIFVSRNAVRRGLELLRARRADKPWPARLAVATVGQGSREELLAQGFAGVIAPAGHADSEALLALAALTDVNGKRIVIFRGEGGRPLLGEELEKRGAAVEYAACYRRVRPAGAGGAMAWPADAVTVSSAEGLENFLRMAGEDAARRLADVPVFVPHARVAGEARRLGLRRVIVAGPRDQEMAAALVAYFGGAG